MSIKTNITILFFLFLNINVYSQKGCNFTKEDFNTYLCLENYSGYTSSIKSQSLITGILSKVGIVDANFILKTCDDTKNATAIFWNNKRYIILDENYLDVLNKNNNDWFYLFVLAHEIGHHLYGHMFEKSDLQKSRNEELQADRFAGLIIRKFGGNINHIKSVLQSINHPQLNNTSHPILTDRLNAAYEGFNSAMNEEKEVIKKYNLITEKEYLQFQKMKQIASARLKAIEFIKDNSYQSLEDAIKLYNIAIGDYDNPDLYSELSSLYSLKGDLNSAEIFIQKAYNVNPKPEYLILSWDYCNDSYSNNCRKYNQAIRNLENNKVTNPNILKILAKFYGTNPIDSEISERLLLNAIKNIESYPRIDQENTLLLSDLYNDLSVTYLMQEKYSQSYAYVKKAIQQKESLKTNSSPLSTINDVDNKNYSSLYYNKALIEMRLEMWQDCIISCDKLLLINPNYKFIVDGSVYYFKARSNHNLQLYKEAIFLYNQAIKLSNTNFGYLYYFRSLSYLAIGDTQNSCIDLKIACDQGFETGCNRYNNFCIN